MDQVIFNWNFYYLFFFKLAFSVRKVETWAEAMAPLVKEGKIRAIGVSNYNIDQVKRFFNK